MEDKILRLDDRVEISDDLKILLPDQTPAIKGTQVIIKNTETGEKLWEGHNKTIIDGSQYIATRIWGLDPIVDFPDYNTELGLTNVSSKNPDNQPVIHLFAVGINGCGQEASQRYPVSYTTHIPANSLVPFRYERGDDIPYEQRTYYFGRKILNATDPEKIRYAYYYKTLQSKQLHMKFTDGSEVTRAIYNADATQKAVTYVEAEAKITKSDCRDIFSSETFFPKLGDGTVPSSPLTLADARINSFTLLRAWYKTAKDEDTGETYRYYMDVHPVTTVHFPNISIVDGSVGISIIYRMFF